MDSQCPILALPRPFCRVLRARLARGVSLLIALSSPAWLLVGPAQAAKVPTPSPAQLVWPAPPETPRIAFVQSIISPADAGAKVTGLRRLTNWISGSQQGNEPINRPFGLAFDDAGNFCMTDAGTKSVCFFDKANNRWYHWDQAGEIPFSSPVAVAKKGNTIFVADASTPPSIIAFDLKGKLLFQITEEVTRAAGLAISGDRLLVADTAGQCIAVFDLHGKFISRFGKSGTGPGEFNFPTHVCADLHGNIFVTDSMNDRVQVFSSSGKFLRQVGKPGDGPGGFGRPKGVGVDGQGRVYVVDAMFDNLQIFDSEARLLLVIGHQGSAPGEFWLPNGVAVAPDNRIYIADTYNGRVQVFQPLDKK